MAHTEEKQGQAADLESDSNVGSARLGAYGGNENETEVSYPEGARLFSIIVALVLSMFMVALDMASNSTRSIVSVACV